MSARDFYSLLELNGFTLARNKKHKVWKGPLGATFVCAATPSDHRAYLNMKTHLKRILREKGRELMEHQGQTAGRRFANTIQIPPSQPPAAPSIEIVELKRAKCLDDEAFEFCKKAKDEGKTQAWCVRALKSLGYKASGTGRELEQTTVSKFTRDRGLFFGEARGTSASGDGLVKVSPVPRKATSKFLNDIQEIITSNLADEAKEKFILMLVQAR